MKVKILTTTQGEKWACIGPQNLIIGTEDEVLRASPVEISKMVFEAVAVAAWNDIEDSEDHVIH